MVWLVGFIALTSLRTATFRSEYRLTIFRFVADCSLLIARPRCYPHASYSQDFRAVSSKRDSKRQILFRRKFPLQDAFAARAQLSDHPPNARPPRARIYFHRNYNRCLSCKGADRLKKSASHNAATICKRCYNNRANNRVQFPEVLTALQSARSVTVWLLPQSKEPLQ
jgi:hypothetical protein